MWIKCPQLSYQQILFANWLPEKNNVMRSVALIYHSNYFHKMLTGSHFEYLQINTRLKCTIVQIFSFVLFIHRNAKRVRCIRYPFPCSLWSLWPYLRFKQTPKKPTRNMDVSKISWILIQLNWNICKIRAGGCEQRGFKCAKNCNGPAPCYKADSGIWYCLNTAPEKWSDATGDAVAQEADVEYDGADGKWVCNNDELCCPPKWENVCADPMCAHVEQ